MDDSYILEARGIEKRFAGVVALSEISFGIKKGGVHALLGENGAGKSTFVNIISGAYAPTGGKFLFDGREYTSLTPRSAIDAGIAIVHQELNLISDISVAENIFLGREIMKHRGKLDWKATYERAEALLKSFDIDFDVRARISSLSVAEQQMVEIVKAASLNAKLIIMDEPTDVLTDKETEHLFRLIHLLKSQGKTIIYISHRLDELKHICDAFSVFRDGRHVFTGPLAEYTKDDIVQMMVARKLDEQYPYLRTECGEPALTIKGLRAGKLVKDVSLESHYGEILGIYGLVGSGRTEMMRAVIGADRKDAGQVQLSGGEAALKSPTEAIRKGIVYITENRKEDGLLLEMSVQFNASLANLDSYLNVLRGLNFRAEKQAVREISQKLAIKTPFLEQETRKLSGGNQQKVLLARYMLTNPKVLIVDEPTRGVDVGAKISIYNILNELKAAGISIIMISSDIPEVLGISDRVLVMHQGRITGHFRRQEFSEDAVAACAFGKIKEEC